MDPLLLGGIAFVFLLVIAGICYALSKPDDDEQRAPSLSEFYSMVAGEADTEDQQINAAVTSRVLAVGFRVLARMRPCDAEAVFKQGIAKHREGQ